jgi:predicted  nucleic acid-binding Zn-ribbon protein
MLFYKILKLSYQQYLYMSVLINFINDANKLYNNKYEYTKTKLNDLTDKVSIICPMENHGEFTIIANNHIEKKEGCKKCYTLNNPNKCRLTTEQFVEKAQEVHSDRYNYSKVIYTGKDDKVKIICKVEGHPEFEQMAKNHIQGKGCPKCGKDSLKLKFRKTQEQFLEEAKKLHGDNYDYSKSVYINDATKVIIICKKCNKEFEQTPNKHLSGCGCRHIKNVSYN